MRVNILLQLNFSTMKNIELNKVKRSSTTMLDLATISIGFSIFVQLYHI